VIWRFGLSLTIEKRYGEKKKSVMGLRLHKVAFDSLISDLKKKNPHWDRKSVGDQGSTARALFTEKILMEDVDSCDEHCF